MPRRSSTRPNPTIFSTEEREEYLVKYGRHQMAHAGFAPDMKYFDLKGKGYIAYKAVRGIKLKKDVFVLGDPVCAESDIAEIIAAFLELFPSPNFVQISLEPTVRVLADQHRFYATQIGVTTIIDLPNWNTKGKKKVNLRNAANTAKKQGIIVREEALSLDDTKRLAKDWLGTRAFKSELKFLVRQPDMPYTTGVRTFCAFDKDGKPIGFVSYDPMYENGKVMGYLASVCRGHPDFIKGLCYAINLHAMDIFKNEGVKIFDLGLSPFLIDEEPFEHSAGFTRTLFKLFYEHGSSFYNCKGLRFAKTRYCGTDVPHYAAHRRRVPLMRVPALLKLVGMI